MAHPRVCGENKVDTYRLARSLGSPPRVRGKRALSAIDPLVEWLTPACAGKTLEGVGDKGRNGAHPRVCGENQVITTACAQLPGSPPRVRGKRGRGPARRRR